MKDSAPSLRRLCVLGVPAMRSLNHPHLRKGPFVRIRNQQPLFLGAMLLGLVLTGLVDDPTRGGKNRETGAAAINEESGIRPLDAAGMRMLLGRRGGRRRPLTLYLFYTACRPCTDRLGDIERLNNEYRDKGLDVALVSIAPMDDRRNLLD